jgi:recombination protein RecR
MKQLVPYENLVALLCKLPGIGRRSAERMALALVQDRDNLARKLADALLVADELVVSCAMCGQLTSRDRDPCSVCSDSRRSNHVLCVVENAGDIMKLEQSGAFKGRYHALGGKLSPMRGIGVADLRIEALLRRLTSEDIREVILGLNTDAESDTTASYLHDLLESRKVKVSRLAYGIPAGSAIEYADPVTLARALSGRVTLD